MKIISSVVLIMVTILIPACTNASAAPTQPTPNESLPILEQLVSDNTTANNEVTDNNASSDNVSASIPVEKLDVYLLVQDNCPYCTQASDYLTGLESEYPIHVIALDVNGSDHMRCIELCKEYGVSPRGVPVLFLSKYWLVGWGKVAEGWVRNWAEECTAGMAVDVETSGDVNVDIVMEGPGTLSVEAEDPSKVNIKVDDNVKVLTTADTK